jgi:hypothetical protein
MMCDVNLVNYKRVYDEKGIVDGELTVVSGGRINRKKVIKKMTLDQVGRLENDITRLIAEGRRYPVPLE